MNDATPPVGLALTAMSPGIQLTWDPTPLAVSYSVCRQTPPSTTCVDLTPTRLSPRTPTNIFVDQTTPGGRPQTYLVTAYRQDQHFGVSQVTGSAGPWPAPNNFRIAQDLSAQGELVLAWDPVPYLQADGTPASHDTYLFGGTGFPVFQVVTGAQIRVKLSPGANQWQVSASYPDPGGGIMPAQPATISYDYARYRLVALGVQALKQTTDDALDLDGRADEIYVAAVTHVTTRNFGGTNVGNVRSTTYGDIGTTNAWPGRVQSGTAGPQGGIRTGDLVPISLDLTAPVGTPNPLGFPLLIWEGPLDPNAMVVVFPTVWEDDNNKGRYGSWLGSIQSYVTGGYSNPATRNEIEALRDAEALGPGVLSGPVLWCPAAVPCKGAGEDREIGLTKKLGGTTEYFNHRFIVLTRSAVDKALAGPPQRAGTTPGVIVVPLFETGVTSTAMYELFLRVDRAP